jgi:hypothetical protein
MPTRGMVGSTTLVAATAFVMLPTRGDGGQFNAVGDPSQSFPPPRPTTNNQTKKKAIEVCLLCLFSSKENQFFALGCCKETFVWSNTTSVTSLIFSLAHISFR